MTAKILLTTAVLLVGRISADAQKGLYMPGDGDVVAQQVLTSLGGDHWSYMAKYAKVTEGTPWFSEEWSYGSLLLESGKRVDNVELRLDLFAREIHYKDADSQEMVLTTPIRALMLAGPGGRTIFIPATRWRDIDKALDGAWLQVLVNDTVSLLHEVRKSMIERTPFGGPAVSIISDLDLYYVQMNGQLIPVRGWSYLPAMFGDKREALARFIRDHHLKGRTPDEYAQTIAYYNTLIK
jgi:hypothetical protein